MQKNEIVAALEPVINALDDLGLSYYIGGSIASSAYGMARSTLDVDLVLELETFHIQPLVNKLKSEYYIKSEMINNAIKEKTSFNIIHLKSMLKIDVFILKDQVYPKKAFERKTKDKLDDEAGSINIYLCSPEDIILHKLEWFKSGGEVSERQWLDILGVIKIQFEKLDKDYLKYWAKQLGVFNLLEKSFSECDIDL
jgi:hypothetical protein